MDVSGHERLIHDAILERGHVAIRHPEMSQGEVAKLASQVALILAACRGNSPVMHSSEIPQVTAQVTHLADKLIGL